MAEKEASGHAGRDPDITGGALPVISHESIEVVANLGLASDRYATGRGFYSGVSVWDAHVTLIQQEPFDDLAAKHGLHIDPKELRRNLVTRGIVLSSMIGRRFRIGGDVVLRAESHGLRVLIL